MQTLQEACIAGRGDHYIEYGGYTWRTLDGADPAGGVEDAPNDGWHNRRWSGSIGYNYLPLPAGWELAPGLGGLTHPHRKLGPAPGAGTDCNICKDNYIHEDGRCLRQCSDTIAVIAAHGWSTSGLVVADGTRWWTGALRDWESQHTNRPGILAGIDLTYLVTCKAGIVTSVVGDSIVGDPSFARSGSNTPSYAPFDHRIVGDSCPPTVEGAYTITGDQNSRVLIRCGAGPRSCSMLPAVDGMTISYSDNQKLGSVAMYSCTQLSHVPQDGDGTRICLGNGLDSSWSGTAPTTCIVRCQFRPVIV